jgi:hypothetical protein
VETSIKDFLVSLSGITQYSKRGADDWSGSMLSRFILVVLVALFVGSK